MRHARKVAVGLGCAAGLAVLAMATAWACIAGPLVTLSTTEVRPGQEVSVNAVSLTGTDTVVFRWNGLDGPVLGTFQPGNDPRFGRPGGLTDAKITIPADAKPGNSVLVLTQVDSSGTLSQVPTRTLVTVTANGAEPILGAPITQVAPERPVGLVEGDSVSTGAKVLAALGVGGLAMFLAGAAAFFAGRGPERAPEAVRR
jgi:hypothetical protein